MNKPNKWSDNWAREFTHPKKKRRESEDDEIRKNKHRLWPRYDSYSCHIWDNITIACIRDLIDNANADVNSILENEITPLHAVCEGNKNPEVIKALIAAGAEVNAVNYSGDTPLHLSAFANNIVAVDILVKSGASQSARNMFGLVPLHMASMSAEDGEGINILRVLLEAGAEVNARDDNGRTPLAHLLSHNPNAKAVALLLAAGAEVTSETFYEAENEANREKIDFKRELEKDIGAEMYEKMGKKIYK